MKKALYILASLAIVACSKSEATYENNESMLAIMPVSHHASKAAIIDNEFPQTNHISLFAYHNPRVTAGTVSNYTGFANNVYLYDAEFYYNASSPTDIGGTIAWSGLNSIYYWPITGSVVFAGYSLPAPTATEPTSSPRIGTASYDLMSDVLKINGYVQSNSTASTFDLLYFGRDGKSYNNRREGTAVPVEFNHALAWITIKVKGGAGALVTGHEWYITDLTLKNVNTKGDFTFNGTPEAEKNEVLLKWDLSTDVAPMVVFDEADGQKLTNTYEVIENVDYGTVVIPQTPKMLSVTLTYKSQANDDIEENFDIDLSLGEGVIWEAGKRYVYNIEFSPTEIKVAPKVTVWPSTGQEGYVETDKTM